MNDCPEHPGQQTMVPCLGCGRSFCRICDAPRGAGQFCPTCYQEQVERLAEKTEKAVPIEAPSEQKAAKGLRSKFARKPRESSEKGKGRTKDRLLAPFRWIDRKAAAAGAGIKSAAVYLFRLPRRIGLYLFWLYRRFIRWVRDRWPITFVPRELLEGNPPFKQAWPKLVAFMAGGIVLWTLLVAFTGIRNPGFSIGVAIIVAGGVIWAMGTKYGLTTGIVAAGLVLVSLVMAELLVQLLFRAGVIKKLDLQIAGLISLEKPSMYYSTFLFKLIVWRLLPSAIVAFLIGWWPLKRRFSWFGFAGRGLEPIPARIQQSEVAPALKEKAPREKRVKKEKAEKPKRARDDKPARRLRVKEKPSGALSKEDLRAAQEKHAKASSDSGATDAEA